MRTWLEIAMERPILVRALKTSLFVGSVLVMINQGDVLLDEGVSAVSLPKVLLTFVVPYLVATSASVSTRLDAMSGSTSGGASDPDESGS